MFLPNHSGDHSAGIVNSTAVNDTDLVNKKYVDDNAGVTDHALLINVTASQHHAKTVSGDIDHDDLSNIPVNDHLDWTADQGATNIHAGNYTDTNTQLSDGDISGFGYTKDVEVDWTVSQAPAVIHTDNYTDTNTTDHTALSNIGTNTHAQLDTHLALTNEHIDWTTDQGATNIDAGNYIDTTYAANQVLDWTADLGATNINAANYTDTTYAANQVIDWTADQGATNIDAGNYIDSTYVAGDFAHNSLSGLNDGDNYEHLTATQVAALHPEAHNMASHSDDNTYNISTSGSATITGNAALGVGASVDANYACVMDGVNSNNYSILKLQRNGASSQYIRFGSYSSNVIEAMGVNKALIIQNSDTTKGAIQFKPKSTLSLTLAGDGTATFVGDVSAASLSGGALLAAYPIGAIYMSVVSTTPATLFGGTWSALAAGKVLVGLDSGDADFDAAEETGGSKTHSLSTAELATHLHVNTVTNAGGGSTGSTDLAHTHSYTSVTSGIGGVLGSGFGSTTSTTGAASPATMNHLHSIPAHGHAMTNVNTGSGTAHTNVQPYLVCYMWKRTA